MAGASSFVHPLCDGTAGHRAWAETLADRVYYSEGLAGFLGWRVARGRLLVKGVRG